MEEVAISEFKAKCLALLERVRQTKKPLRITRFGKPVAEVVPATPKVTDVKIVEIDIAAKNDPRFPTPVFGFQLMMNTFMRGPRIRPIGEYPGPTPAPLVIPAR